MTAPPHASPDGNIIYGKCYASYIRSVSDVDGDPDPYPDIEHLTGFVKFEAVWDSAGARAALPLPSVPRTRGLVVSGDTFSVVDSNLVDKEGREGVWLVAEVDEIPLSWRATVTLTDSKSRTILNAPYIITEGVWARAADGGLSVNLPDLIPNPSALTPVEGSALRAAERTLREIQILKDLIDASQIDTSGSASSALTYRNQAQGFRNEAEGFKNTATTQAGLATTARTGAETARTGAQTAQTTAETAQAHVEADHSHIHLDVEHIDTVAETVGAALDQANVFAQDQVPPYLQESALSATYVSLDAVGIVQATDHGIVADGVTDNAAALNALMADVSAAGGGHIVLPAGEIRHVGWLIPHSNVRLSGAGQNVTVFLPEEYGFYAEATALAPLTNFHMEHLTIDGRNRTGQKTWKGYHGQYHYRCTWQSMTVRNTGMTGLGPDMLRDCLIFNVTTENTGLNNDGTQPSGNGIGIGAGAYPGWESFSIIGCTVKNAKRYGIMVEGGLIRTAAKIIGNTASECHSGGFGIGAGTGTIVTGNTAQSNLGNGFEFSNLTLASARMSGECIVSGNVAQDNGGDGITYDASAQRPAEGFPQIINNMCTKNGGHGIRVAMNLTLVHPQSVVTGFKIDGNTCSLNELGGITLTSTGSTTDTPVAWTIDNNTLHRNGSSVDRYGIRIGIPLQGASIRNNMFYFSGIAESGISVGHGGAVVTLTACRIEGNTSANPASKVLNVASTATLDASCVVQGNFPDDGSPRPKVLTANATLTAVDRVVVADGASSIYIPKPNEVRAGRELVVKNVNATSVTLRFSAAGSTIDGAATLALARWESVTLVSDGGTRWLAV